MKKLTSILTLLFLLTVTPAFAAVQVGTQAPDFSAEDADGNKVSLSDFAGKHVVLEWSNFDCPYVRKHYDGGNMQGLQKTYTGKDVVWLTILSSAPGKQGYLEGEELKTRVATEGSNATQVLRDPSGEVGHLYEATNTPHMYVITPGGELAYMGAIDSIKSGDKSDIEKAENYVSSALDELLAGKPVTTAFTTPYGCGIKY